LGGVIFKLIHEQRFPAKGTTQPSAKDIPRNARFHRQARVHTYHGTGFGGDAFSGAKGDENGGKGGFITDIVFHESGSPANNGALISTSLAKFAAIARICSGKTNKAPEGAEITPAQGARGQC
jgi:hypothetical protein